MKNALIIPVVLLFMLPIVSANAAVSCDKHPIYCQIIKNYKILKKKKINKRYAMQLSNIIHKITKRYKIDARIYTAILAQESAYKMGAKNCLRGLRRLTEVERSTLFREKIKECKDAPITDPNFDVNACVNKKGDEVEATRKESKICTDFGISQIHYGSIKRFKFNTHRLLTDKQYSIDAGAKVLQGFYKRYGRKESKWWTRYNASSLEKRREYARKVSRFL